MWNFAGPLWQAPLALRSLVNIDHCKDELISETNRIEVSNTVPFVSFVSWNQVGEPRIHYAVVVN